MPTVLSSCFFVTPIFIATLMPCRRRAPRKRSVNLGANWHHDDTCSGAPAGGAPFPSRGVVQATMLEEHDKVYTTDIRWGLLG